MSANSAGQINVGELFAFAFYSHALHDRDPVSSRFFTGLNRVGRTGECVGLARTANILWRASEGAERDAIEDKVGSCYPDAEPRGIFTTRNYLILVTRDLVIENCLFIRGPLIKVEDFRDGPIEADAGGDARDRIVSLATVRARRNPEL